MNKQDKIKQLYFEEKYNQIQIARELNVSNKYVSKVLNKDLKYQEEKENRKKISKQKHRTNTINYIKNKRKSNEYDIIYEQLKQMHIQASQELSRGKNIISNRSYRYWNSSVYRYNPKTKCYHLKKEIITGYDVPKKIYWNI